MDPTKNNIAKQDTVLYNQGVWSYNMLTAKTFKFKILTGFSSRKGITIGKIKVV